MYFEIWEGVQRLSGIHIVRRLRILVTEGLVCITDDFPLIDSIINNCLGELYKLIEFECQKESFESIGAWDISQMKQSGDTLYGGRMHLSGNVVVLPFQKGASCKRHRERGQQQHQCYDQAPKANASCIFGRELTDFLHFITIDFLFLIVTFIVWIRREGGIVQTYHCQPSSNFFRLFDSRSVAVRAKEQIKNKDFALEMTWKNRIPFISTSHMYQRRLQFSNGLFNLYSFTLRERVGENEKAQA
jgi:hypothetical protein